MKILISFGSEKYFNSLEVLKNSAKKYFDKIILYTPDDLSKEFKEENKEILSYSRGYGYWLWKPYIIQKTLNEYSNSFIFYSDALSIFENFPENLCEICENNKGILCGSQIHQEKFFTKRDVFVELKCDNEEYYNNYQISASHIFLQNISYVKNIIDDWFSYCKNKILITDHPSLNMEKFKNSHRHDQSILSLLLNKNNIPKQKCFCQYGEEWKINNNFMAHSSYNKFINHHRNIL